MLKSLVKGFTIESIVNFQNIMGILSKPRPVVPFILLIAVRTEDSEIKILLKTQERFELGIGSCFENTDKK